MRSPHVARKQNPPKMIQHFRNLGGWLTMILDIQYGPWLNGLDDKIGQKSFASGVGIRYHSALAVRFIPEISICKLCRAPSVFSEVRSAQGCGTQQKVVCTSMPLFRISVEGFVMQKTSSIVSSETNFLAKLQRTHTFPFPILCVRPFVQNIRFQE